ncbi:MAG TPA: acyl-CoA dehydrogenase [Eoetvoesiella sp.]
MADNMSPSRATRFCESDEERQLAASADRFVQASYSYEAWRGVARSSSYSSENWSQMSELGWLMLGLPTEHEGLGLGIRETMILMESLGRGIVLEPYWSTAVLCAQLIQNIATPTQQSELLPRIAHGKLRLAFADTEPGKRWQSDSPTCNAVKRDGKFWITGNKIAVLDAPCADALLVLASCPDGGVSVFLVQNDAKGVCRRDFPTVDSRRCADIRFDDAPAEMCLGTPGEAAQDVALAKDYASIALCAESLGAMKYLIETTIEYLKTRQQFGRPLADFQVLRHRVVDMFIASEQARSLTIMAAATLDRSPAERGRSVSAAKWQCGRAGIFIGEAAVHLHGGVGMTEELPVGQYFKRLLAIDALLGNAGYHLQRFIQLS